MGRTTAGYGGRNAPLFSTMMVALADERVESLSTAQPTSAEAELDIVVPTSVTSTVQTPTLSPTQRKSPRTKRFPSPLESYKKPTPKLKLNIKTPKSVSTKPDKPEPSSKLKKKVVKQKGSDHAGRALTTAVTPFGGAQDSENITKTLTAATPLGGPRCQETKGEMEASARQEIHSERSNDSLPVGTQQGNDEDSFDQDMLQMSKDLTDETPVPMRTKFLKKKKHQQKSSNEPSTAGTQQLVGEDRYLLQKLNELTVIPTVPKFSKKTSSHEDRATMTRKELTVKVQQQEEQIQTIQGLVSSLSKHIQNLTHSSQTRSSQFKGEKKKKAEYKLPTPSQSTDDEFEGEIGITSSEETGDGRRVEEGTGISMEERYVEVSEGIETAAQQVEISLQRETAAIDTLVLAIAAPASTEGLMMLADVSTSLATANLTTTGGNLTTTGSTITTAAPITTAGSSQSELSEVIEERTAGMGVLVNINYRERNFSETSAPGAGTSNPHFSQERYLAELLAKRKEEKLQEENLAREAEQVVARQSFSTILNRGATLRIHVVPTKEPRKVFVAGKGKKKVRELTKLEQKAQFFADQAMARLNRFIENKENLKHLQYKRILEEDLLVWDSIAQKQKDEELARKLQEGELAEREKAESEKLKKEKLKDELFKAGVKKLESKRKLPLRYHPRTINDKQIFMEYLKNTGKYSGKQLGPMGIEKMKELYDKERKARADKDEVIDISKEEFERGVKKDSESDSIDIERYEAEKRAKAKWDRDERARLNRLEKERIKEQKRIEAEEKKRKMESLVSRTSERKKRKMEPESSVADSTGYSTTHPQPTEVISEADVLDVQPLNSEVPIVNWFATEQEKKQVYRVEKADGSFMYFYRPKRIFSEMNINELAQMYQVGIRLERVANRLDRNNILFRFLQMMFEPDKLSSEISIFEDVHSWEVFAKSGVYCIQFKSDLQYFLVEKEYKHNVNVMRMLLKKTLIQLQVTEYADMLIKKITKQIEDLKKRKRED